MRESIPPELRENSRIPTYNQPLNKNWSKLREISKVRGLRIVVLLAAVLAVALTVSPASYAVNQTSVGSGYTAVNAAFTATQSAARQGGNVTALISKLNSALALIQKAAAENATNPAQASADLANATLIALGVATAAGPVGRQGAASRQLQLYLSVGSAMVVIAAAALIYVFGDRIYRRAWLRLYGNQVVKQIG